VVRDVLGSPLRLSVKRALVGHSPRTTTGQEARLANRLANAGFPLVKQRLVYKKP
jgi:hypothetical protein